MITLSPSQQAACDAFRVFLKSEAKTEFLLSGFAGSGKSFLVTYLLELVCDEYQLVKLIHPGASPTNFRFTATTNKAASVLSDMVHAPTKTIHSTLGLTIFNDYGTGKTRLVAKNDCENLNDTVLIIDEASMINQELLKMIRKAARGYRNCKILYVGDSYQLPPVRENACPIFNTCADIHFLTDIQRQAAGSPIITLSHKYREILDDETLPWPKLQSIAPAIQVYTGATEWKQSLIQHFMQEHEVDDIRIVAWSNNKVRGYNNWIRKHLGHTEPFSQGEKVLCNNAIVMGDRLMAKTDSIHTIEEATATENFGIFGHMIKVRAAAGRDVFTIFQPADWTATRRLSAKLAKKAKEAKRKNDSVAASGYWRKFFEIKNEWGDFRPIHAQTVHKSQGSTYQKIFIDVADIAKNNKWYEVARLMYVAITRASHEVHLYGELEERYNRNDPNAIMEVFKNATTS